MELRDGGYVGSSGHGRDEAEQILTLIFVFANTEKNICRLFVFEEKSRHDLYSLLCLMTVLSVLTSHTTQRQNRFHCW